MSVATDHDCLYDRKALEEIFELCDLDDNGTMSKDEFNWFNLRTSGEELGDDEWQVVEGRKCWQDVYIIIVSPLPFKIFKESVKNCIYIFLTLFCTHKH